MNGQKPRSIRIDKNWNWHMEAKTSADNKTWSEVEMSDISDGGLGFSTSKSYNKGDILFIDAYINPKMVRFGDISITTQSVVTGVRQSGENNFIVGVRFTGLSNDAQSYLGSIVDIIISKYGVADAPGFLET